MQREAWFVVGLIVIVVLMVLAVRDAQFHARVHGVEREGSKLSRTDVPRTGKSAK